MTLIDGYCAPKFERVKEAFEQNFEANDEIGASVSIFCGSDRLVDLWGGHTDREKSTPWQEDTLVNVWSTTKGVLAACFAAAVDGGALNYDDKVADHWPEFAVGGKQNVSVGELLSHQSGLCGFRSPAATEDYYDLETAAARLAAAEPFWPPGSQSGYHAISIGALGSALLKRTEGRYVQQFVADELNTALGLDIFIGLPSEHTNRCSLLIAPPEMDSAATSTSPELTEAQIATLANPPLDAMTANTAEWRAADIPSANGHATARALAELYAMHVSKSETSQRLASQKAIQQATQPQCDGVDVILGIEARWGCGFMLNSTGLYGPNPNAFGHSGWGGSFAFADPDAGIGVAYTMNRMGTDLVGDPRNGALIEAIYASL